MTDTTLVPSRSLQLLHEDGPFEVPRQRREPNAVRPRALARDGVPRPGDEGRFDLGACVEFQGRFVRPNGSNDALDGRH